MPRSEIRRNWRLLVAALTGASMGMPTIAFFSIGMFAPIFAEEFAWSYSQIMGGLIITSSVILLLGPVIGRAIDRYGTRIIASVSLAGLGLSYMSFGLATGSITQYYLSWLSLSVLGIGATAISFSHVISQHFSVQRGIALGITLAGSGVCAVLVKAVGSLSIDLIGWRATMMAIGAVPVLIGVPVVLWGFPRHRPVAAEEAAVRLEPDAGPPVYGLTLREALTGRAFWLIALAFIPIAFANGAPMPNMENILRTLALDPAQVVAITSLIGVSILIGRIGGGWLVDHIWAPAVAAVLLLSSALGCFLLAQGAIGIGQGYVAVVLISMAAGVEYDLLAFLIARYIGTRSFGAVSGIMFGIFAIGAGGGPVLLGHVFDTMGSYSTGLIICGAALIFAAIPALMLGRYPLFDTGERPAAH